jgi:TrmH family RNA methyltransferase
LDFISSRDNHLLKETRKLKIKKYRSDNKRFLAEGMRFVEEAVFSRAAIKYCLCSENLYGNRAEKLIKKLKDMGISIYTLKESLMDEICETSTPQGIAAVIEEPEYDLYNILENSDFLVVADRIQDPGNLGTIIRTSDAAGAQGLIITEGTVDPYGSKVLRSTMGSIFHIPVINILDILSFVETLKKRDFTIYATSLDASEPYYSYRYDNKTVVVIGNEANGVSEGIIKCADRLIKIPMRGKAESLNAAVACGILLFEVTRSRSNIDK